MPVEERGDKQRVPQSIPLQDLSRPPDPARDHLERPGLARSLSGGTRALLGGRESFSARTHRHGPGRYEQLLSPEANEPNIPSFPPPIRVNRQSSPFDEGELSPINIGDFQAANSSVGLSFDTSPGSGSSGTNLPKLTTTSPLGMTRLNPISEDDSGGNVSPLIGSGPSGIVTPASLEEDEEYFGQTGDDDKSPLTDSRYLQPISGTERILGQRHDRIGRGMSKSFSGAMLGDDLARAENGTSLSGNRRSAYRKSSLSTHSLGRSLTVSGNTLSTAGNVFRKMSQRVVNLSNEPEMVEQEIRRHASTKLATLDAPPSFPAFTEYRPHSAFESPRPSTEKPAPSLHVSLRQQQAQQQLNPLEGKSLGLFSKESRVRKWLLEVLVHPFTEPLILFLILLQTIVLAVDAATEKLAPDPGSGQPVAQPGPPWGHTWSDVVLFILFLIYTIETVARVIVSGFIKNPERYSTLKKKPNQTFFQAAKMRAMGLLSTTNANIQKGPSDNAGLNPSILRSFTAIQGQPEQKGHGRQAQRIRLARRAFLRHSFNRLDFLAVSSFWISFILNLTEVQPQKHIYAFQMISCLRILRLLNLTNGTSVILRSLKKAAPLLVHVAFLICFFWLLFAIVGVQTFKASLRRTCVWYGDDIVTVYNTPNPSSNETLQRIAWAQNQAPNNLQFCGSHSYYLTGEPLPYVISNLTTNGTDKPKGFTCPRKSLCVEDINPYANTVSFDNTLNALELVFVIMSGNTFSDLLYYTSDSDYLGTSLFFVFGIVLLTLWLINLLVAVITSSFQVIREESRSSAFTIEDSSQVIEDEEEPKRKTLLKRIYDKTYWFWIAIILVSLISQAVKSADASDSMLKRLNGIETAVTLLLLLEIVLRFISDWRKFHRETRNWFDLALAIITSVMQVPPIRNSGEPYAWLTFFQIVRVYRVVLAVPITRDLIMTVLGNVSGILNLILFVVLMTFFASIFAVQLFRGDFPLQDINGNFIRITFKDIYNAFIGMYQILSSENWTSILYSATQNDLQWTTAWIAGIFFILWFISANIVILNMFIAVIQENFDVTEDEKRVQQVKAFCQQKELTGSSHSNLSLSTIFRWRNDKDHYKDYNDYGPTTIDMFKDTIVRDFLDEQMEALDHQTSEEDTQGAPVSGQVQPGVLSAMWGRIAGIFRSKEPNPFYSRLQLSRNYEELDPRRIVQQIRSATEQRKEAQRRYLQAHPRYNVSLYLFKPDHPLRQFCQQMVGPGRGNQRVEGVEPLKPVWYAFSFVIYSTIVVMVILACLATPLYQRQYYIDHGQSIRNWFVWTDMAFAVVFTFEAAIKVIADGFFFTPNAYFRSAWGFIDGVVLVTLWINVATSLYDLGDVARAVGAFKALRALRLLNISDSARDTFHSVIILGGWKIISAAFVSLSLLIPFAIYGLNLFNGQFMSCNDSSMNTLSECIGEYNSAPFNNDWQFFAPRQVANPYYNFDDFGSALFILFQIVSQEGWTDVMFSGIAARGKGMQPQNYASPGNSIFFIVFNLLGAVFVLTLFVSVFMRNYTEQTGVAFLTAEQRSWLELRKLLRQISPSKRPQAKRDTGWKNWCYKVSVKKHGKWQRTITTILCIHLILLVLEFYPEDTTWEYIRNSVFLAFTVIYVANIFIRLVGLTWTRFRRSSWDLYSILSVSGTLICTILDFVANPKNRTYIQLHKIFLVSIALLLIPRNNQLDQLFKTAAASLTAIGSLLATWFVLFLVWAIALTQTLGLTKFGSNGSSNLNFRNVPNALILLFRMSCGEGWNAIMEDFTVTAPNCIKNPDFFDSDCGSVSWARSLFILWNIISMYIFVSMFVSLIFESFSYVYQRSSGLSAVSREEIRRFKEAWAQFDPNGTGYIRKDQFPRLLAELSGIFEMRIYDGDYTVRAILDDCKVENKGGDSPNGVVEGIDLAKLNARLATIDIPETRRRREKLNLFSREVLVSADPDRGVQFSTCLLILAHHNIINDKKALRLEEFLRRSSRLQLVQEEVHRQIVQGFFDMVRIHKRFRRRQEIRGSARVIDIPQFAVPEIFVDDMTPMTADFPRDEYGGDVSPLEATPERNRTVRRLSPHSRENSPSRSPRTRGESFGDGSSPARSEYSFAPSAGYHSRQHSRQSSRQSDGLEPFPNYDGADFLPEPRGSTSVDIRRDLGSSIEIRHRRGQSSVGSQRMDTLAAFDNSAWGESIRRSFTLRRSTTRGRGRSSRAE